MNTMTCVSYRVLFSSMTAGVAKWAGVFCVSVLGAMSVPAYGWWDKGHQVGCGLAYELLSESDRHKLDQILSIDDDAQLVSATGRKKFIYACTRPDHPHERTCDHTLRIHSHIDTVNASNWDVAVDNSGNTNKDGNPACNTLAASNGVTDNLSESIPYEYEKARNSEGQERIDAIKYISHFLGDIQQPLHVGYYEDWIGNKLWVDDGSPRDFHAFWDHYILKKANDGESLRVDEVVDHWVDEIHLLDVSGSLHGNLATYLNDIEPPSTLQERVNGEAIRSHYITQAAYCDLAIENAADLDGVPVDCESAEKRRLAREAIFTDDAFPESVLRLSSKFTQESSLQLDKATASIALQATYPYQAKHQLLHSALSIYRTLTALLNDPALLPFIENAVLVKTAEKRYEWEGYEGTYAPIGITLHYPTAPSESVSIGNISRGSMSIIEPIEQQESPVSVELNTQSSNAWFVHQVAHKAMGKDTAIAQDKFIAMSTEPENVVSLTTTHHEFCMEGCALPPVTTCQSDCSIEIVTGGLSYSGTNDAPTIVMEYADSTTESLPAFTPYRHRTYRANYLVGENKTLTKVILQATGGDAWYIEAVKLKDGTNLIQAPKVLSTQPSDAIGGIYSVPSIELSLE